ncbi:MAG: hypothetical protein IBJ13_13880 [Sphingopyxis sp.]|nr:hypothetical protein [Sphingopyxis sp.]
MARQTESQRLRDASGADDAELFDAGTFHDDGLARPAMLRQYRYALRRGCKGAQSAPAQLGEGRGPWIWHLIGHIGAS